MSPAPGVISAGTIPTASTTTPTTVMYRSTPTSTQSLDIYQPNVSLGDAPATGACCYIFHGGGFTSSTASSLDTQVVSLARRLAKIGITALAVNYRYAQAGVPSSQFPGATLDAMCAIRWGQYNLATYGADWHRAGVIGLSAGGTLAAHAVLCMRLGIVTLPNGTSLYEPSAPYQPGPHDRKLVARYGTCYAVFDVTNPAAVTSNPFPNLYTYLGVANQADPQFTPRAQDASPGLLAHNDPTLFHWHGHGSSDTIVFPAQTSTFAPSNCTIITGETHNYDPGASGIDLAANLTMFWGGRGSLIGGL